MKIEDIQEAHELSRRLEKIRKLCMRLEGEATYVAFNLTVGSDLIYSSEINDVLRCGLAGQVRDTLRASLIKDADLIEARLITLGVDP